MSRISSSSKRKKGSHSWEPLQNLCAKSSSPYCRRFCLPSNSIFVCLQTAYLVRILCVNTVSTRMHTRTTRTMLSKASKIDGRKPPRFLVRGTTISPIIVHSCVPLLLPFVVFSVDAALTSFAILTVTLWQRSKACLQFITCQRYLGDGTETVELSTRPNF